MGAVEHGKAIRGEIGRLVGGQAQALEQEPACSGPVVTVVHPIVGLWLQHYALDNCVHNVHQQTCMMSRSDVNMIDCELQCYL